MALQGFDKKWRDLPDYILGITHEIWEQRQIHTLHHYYADDIVVRSPGSVVVGNKGVIAATMATLAEFPDRKLLGEDVIYSGSESEGYMSSHRILTTAIHSQPGVYGAATGKTLSYWVIGDCAAKNNQIYDEWLVRDQGAIVRQLGWNPADYARDLIAREGGPEHCVAPLTPASDMPGAYQGQGNDNAYGQQYTDLIQRIMQAEISVVRQGYDRACHLQHPGGFAGHGYATAEQFWMGLRASFPSATFNVDHQIGREDEMMSPRAALRWSLHGKHDGWGAFGQPTGAEVYILGISHAEFGPRGLRREWILYDETSIWKQIALQLG